MTAALRVTAWFWALVIAPFGCGRETRTEEPNLSARRDRLIAEKQRLERELRDHIGTLPVTPEQVDTDVDVVVAIPNTVVEEVMTRTLTDGLGGLSLRVHDLRIHIEDEVKAKLLIARATVADVELDVLLQDLRGTISTETPKVAVGRDRIRVELTMKAHGGRGRARIHLRLKGRGIARAVCGDVDVVGEVEGVLKPLALHLEGAVFLEIEGAHLTVRPDFPAQRFRLRVDPSDEAWAKIEQLVKEQEGACRFALERVDVKRILQKILDEGFRVTLHTERLKPVRVPVTISPQVRLEDGVLELVATLRALEIRDDYVWLGSDLTVSSAGAAR